MILCAKCGEIRKSFFQSIICKPCNVETAKQKIQFINAGRASVVKDFGGAL